MTPRDLLIGVWPWSLPDETASQGVDMVLKALDAAGFVITEKAEIGRLHAGNKAIDAQFRVWRERAEKAEAEIERLRALVNRCAAIAENPGFIEAQDTDWDEGVNYAKRFIAAAIRHALEPKP